MSPAATQPKRQRISKRGRLNEGRPLKRTPELTASIAESISLGLTDEEAAAIANITPWTFEHVAAQSRVFQRFKKSYGCSAARQVANDRVASR